MHLVLVQVLGIAIFHQIVVPFAKKKYCKTVTKGTHVIQHLAVASKPREILLSNGCVETFDAVLLQSGFASWIAGALACLAI